MIADDDAAARRAVPDLLAPGLRILFSGINPGRRSGATGHHFAGPGNRFWPALHLAGLTPRRLRPDEQDELIGLGIGITNLVPRTTRAAAELTAGELRQGARRLESLVARVRPCTVAVLGMGAYRTAFRRPRAMPGPQPEPIAGAGLWLLPNPSGLQARYGLDDLAGMMAALGRAAG